MRVLVFIVQYTKARTIKRRRKTGKEEERDRGEE